MTELPIGPWRKVSVDFAGPFEDMAGCRIYRINFSGQCHSAFHMCVQHVWNF